MHSFARTLPCLIALAAGCNSSSNNPGGDSNNAMPGMEAGPGDGNGDGPNDGDPKPGEPYTVIAAGDIASDEGDADLKTAQLVESLPGTVLVLGDNAYDDGTLDDYMTYYEPTWGKVKNRTRPVPGNHEYADSDRAEGYFEYFGEAAGDPTKGYYSFDLGNWHLVAINTNADSDDPCQNISCNAGSEQEEWLRRDLAASTKPCTLAYWHHPRYSTGKDHGSNPGTQALWVALDDFKAEIILTGHDHDYERFKPLNTAGQVDEAEGIVQFVVGTGGRHLDGVNGGPTTAASGSAFGVLHLKLYDDRAEFEFKAIEGESLTDSGTIMCH